MRLLSQDEGMLLVYPSEILKGAVPNVSFASTYGAASLWGISAAFLAGGESVGTERAVGLVYELALVAAMAALAWRRRGPLAAATAGIVCVILRAPLGVAAFAWMGGLAFGATALLLLDIAFARGGRRWALVAAGACLGLAVSYRLDLSLAVGLTLAGIAVTRARAIPLVVSGALLGSLPLVVNAVQAGVGNVVTGQLTDPIFVSGSGRRLPLSGLSTTWLVVLVVCVSIAVAHTALGIVALRRDRSSLAGATSLLIGAFEIAILPQAFQRADAAHVAFVACFILATAAAVSPPVVSLRVPRVPWAIVTGGLALVLAVTASGKEYALASARSLGLRDDPEIVVSHHDRTVPVDSDEERKDLLALLRQVDESSKPGMTVFVCPQDLRRTNYNDTVLYFLLPRLRPATFYLEMNPGIDIDASSRLVGELQKSDVLILTSRWDPWSEPNDSRRFGPAVANEIVRREFRVIGRWGSWTLLVNGSSSSSST
jgi:intracellular sulfur oxidation DsrE/DsrF family protein